MEPNYRYSLGVSFSGLFFHTDIFFSHIYPQWKEIEKECRRVTKENGTIIIVSTWSLDTGLIRDTFGDKAVMKDDFLIVRIAV